MNAQQLDFLIKALVDGIVDLNELARRAGVVRTDLTPLEAELERGMSLIRGFYQYASENMKPAGLPPPRNLYHNPEKSIDAQSPEYYAFEAVQRGRTSMDECLIVCQKLGIPAEIARPAIENVSIPWREINGWRSYAQQTASGTLILMNKTPLKIKLPLTHLRERCEVLLGIAPAPEN
jgi:hypothetical protein